MKRIGGGHLSPDEMVRAVVDEAQLPRRALEHLAGCPKCREARGEIEGDLLRLNRMARRSAPSLKAPITLPEELPRGRAAGLWGTPAYLGASIAAGILLAVVLWGWFGTVPQNGVDTGPRNEWPTDSLMAEVETLVENPLPPVYLEISGETATGFNEAFLEFIVPSVEETENLSLDRTKGGILPC